MSTLRGPVGPDARPSVWPWIGFLASGAFVLGGYLAFTTQPCGKFQLGVQFAWSSGNLASEMQGCIVDISSARASLRWDFLFMLGYTLLLFLLLRALLVRGGSLWAIRHRRLFLALPWAAGVCDLAENTLSLCVLQTGSDGYRFAGPGWVPPAITVVAIGKWLLILVTIILGVVFFVGWSRRGFPDRATTLPDM